jgi:hypothetical protein
MHLHEGGVEGIISTMIECGMTGRYRLSIYERCEGTDRGGGQPGSNESVCGQHNRCGEDLVFRSLLRFPYGIAPKNTSGDIPGNDVQ